MGPLAVGGGTFNDSLILLDGAGGAHQGSCSRSSLLLCECTPPVPPTNRQGEYRYPNGSCYNGAWKAGLKHGQGSYRDTAGGCLSGAWAAGVMMGQGLYEQPHYKFEGQWFKGVPAGACRLQCVEHAELATPDAAFNRMAALAGDLLRPRPPAVCPPSLPPLAAAAGPCTFTLGSTYRSQGLSCPAATHLRAAWGPTLAADGQYTIPAGEWICVVVAGGSRRNLGPAPCQQHQEMRSAWHKGMVVSAEQGSGRGVAIRCSLQGPIHHPAASLPVPRLYVQAPMRRCLRARRRGRRRRMATSHTSPPSPSTRDWALCRRLGCRAECRMWRTRWRRRRWARAADRLAPQGVGEAVRTQQLWLIKDMLVPQQKLVLWGGLAGDGRRGCGADSAVHIRVGRVALRWSCYTAPFTHCRPRQPQFP